MVWSLRPSITLSVSLCRGFAVKFFVDRDLSWGALAGALGLMFLVSSALRGPLPEGPFSARVPVLTQYAGAFLAALLMGGAIVLVLWGVKRLRSERYETPRRDLAIAVLLMTIVTFRPVQAASPPCQGTGAEVACAASAGVAGPAGTARGVHAA